jgi:hypothetical protein
MPVAWRLAECLRVPSRRTIECRRRRLTCPWHGGSLRALHVPSRRTMERHRPVVIRHARGPWQP